MQFRVTFGQQFAGFHEVAFLNRDVLAARNEVFLGVAGFWGDHDLALALGFRAKGDQTVDFRDHRHFLGLADLEQLGDAGKTADDVLGLGGLAGLTRDDVAFEDILAVAQHENRANRHGEDGRGVGAGPVFGIAPLVHDGDRRTVRGGAVFDDGLGGALGGVVHLLLVGLAFDDVGELDHAGDVGDERFVERVPFGQQLVFFHFLAGHGVQFRAGRQAVALALAALVVDHRNLAGLAHHDGVALLVDDGLDAREHDAAAVLGRHRRLGDFARRRAADVEGTHGELGARLADGLGGDDAHGLADVDQVSPGQVAAVAHGAHAVLGLAGQGRADHQRAEALVFDDLGVVLVNERVGRDDDLVGDRIVDVEHAGPAQGAFVDALLDVAGLDVVGDLQAVDGAAVDLGDDDVLDDIDQTAGQVTGVCGLKRRIGQTLTSAVSGVEVLGDREALAEVRGDGRLDDFAGRLGHKAAHAGQLAHLVLVASRSGVDHHEDRVAGGVFLHPPGGFIGQRIPGDLLHHFRGHVVGGLGPDVDDLVVFLGAGDDALAVLDLDVVHLFLGGIKQTSLGGRDGQVLDADGDAGPGGVLVAEVF